MFPLKSPRRQSLATPSLTQLQQVTPRRWTSQLQVSERLGTEEGASTTPSSRRQSGPLTDLKQFLSRAVMLHSWSAGLLQKADAEEEKDASVTHTRVSSGPADRHPAPCPLQAARKRWRTTLDDGTASQTTPVSFLHARRVLSVSSDSLSCQGDAKLPGSKTTAHQPQPPSLRHRNNDTVVFAIDCKTADDEPSLLVAPSSLGGGAARARVPPKRQRDIVQDDDGGDSGDDNLYVRRHTIGDMTVAAYGMVICGMDDMHHRYRGRIEKVKFGVPIAEAFSHDIPATLLVLLLKVNKEGPLKKDIWRAPGNQAQVRKLSHIMQHGRLVNISNISVYTAASVIKKFLSKLPGGIFGDDNEQELFSIVQQPDSEQQRQVFCRVICSLSVPSQHLLVLLFGTFRIISDSAETFGTRMTPDAIGISVAPSLFHTCIHDGQRAKLEDVMRFKLASQVISKIIQGFGYTNLFPRECYEFYARITGRTLRVDEHWHFTFQYPSRTFSQPAINRCDSPTPETGETAPASSSNTCYTRRRNTADVTAGGGKPGTSSSVEPLEREFADQRLSNSMGEVLVHSDLDDDEPRCMSSQCAEGLESTRSLTYLEWVHERQTKRMRTRSEWFLSPVMPSKNNSASKSVDFKQQEFAGGSLTLPQSDVGGLISTEEMHVSPVPEEEATPRVPFQELQKSTTTLRPASDHSGATTPLAKTPKETFFAAPGIGLPAVVAVTPRAVANSSGVVRKKSWRTHYVRPNKSFDGESLGNTDDLAESTHSTPARRSSTTSGSQRSAVSGEDKVTTEAPDRILARRKSSGSNGSRKAPIQARRSTQI